MNLAFTFSVIAAVIGVGSQVADGVTTYIGVKKAGPGIEGDGGYFCAIAVAIMLSILGYMAAYDNYKVNKTL